MKNDKRQQFIDWLCGDNIKFPFMQDLPEVKLPDGFEPEESDEQFSNESPVEGFPN